MKNPLNGPKLKIKRAYEHIDEINRLVISAFVGDVYSLVEEIEPETGDRLLKIKFTGVLPEELHTRVAEVAYHLRSSLDQLMTALTVANNAAITRDIFFPFAGSAQEFVLPRSQRKMERIHASAAEVISELKPYRGGNDDLWGLSRLSVMDKHSVLIPFGGIASLSVLRNVRVTNAKIGIIISGNCSLDKGIVISNLGTNGTFQPLDNKKANIEVNGTVAFGKVDIFENKPITTTLLNLTQLVERIVKLLEPHC